MTTPQASIEYSINNTCVLKWQDGRYTDLCCLSTLQRSIMQIIRSLSTPRERLDGK